MIDFHTAASVACRFALGGKIFRMARHAGGHIHDSYVIRAGREGKETRYLLQRINRTVFAQPEQLMENVVHVTRHLARELERAGASEAERKALRLVPTLSGKDWHEDARGNFWRMFVYIESTFVLDRATAPEEIFQAARAFGEFQKLLANYDGPPLHETIPHFHDTPRRLADFESVAQSARGKRARKAQEEIRAVRQQASLAAALEQARARGALPTRIVHNDAKLSNVLFDAATRQAICVVDLDTTMPGVAPFDFGDMMRSMLSPAAEDDPAEVEIRLPWFEALVSGYFEAARGFLQPGEIECLVAAGKVITYEQALRFLTDYLRGDCYYMVQRPGQNLDRCRAQLRLLEAIVRQERELEEIVRRLAGRH